MRVLHVSDSFPGAHRSWGGAEMACKRYIDVLLGHDQFLITQPPDFPDIDYPCEHYSIALFEGFRSQAVGKLLAYTYNPGARRKFSTLLDRLKPDVIHFHRFKTLSWSLAAEAFNRKTRTMLSLYDSSLFCPKETLMHSSGKTCSSLIGFECAVCLRRSGFPPLRSLLWRIRAHSIKKLAFNFDKFAVLSPSWLQMLSGFGIPEHKHTVIPLPLTKDILCCGSHDAHTNTMTILYVGWFQERKGLLELLYGFNALRDKIPTAKLTLVRTGGNAQYERKAQQYIAGHHLESSLTILGRKTPDEVSQLLREAEVIAIPEQWDNPFPVFLSEAMSFAKKIVASRIGGITSLIGAAEERGWLVSPKNIDEWSMKLHDALLAPENKAIAGEAFIQEYCGIDTIRNKLEECYSG